MTKNQNEKPKISYEECDRLVKKYRDEHDEMAAEALIDAFEGYIINFYNAIRWGKINIHDRSLREFVKLYMKEPYDRRHIHQYRHMPSIKKVIYKTCDSIRMLCEPYDNEELKNEIIVAFLTMAKRYNSPDDKPRFHTYVLKAFHYQLRRQLQTLVADPIVFKMAHNIQFFDDDHEGEGTTIDVGDLEDESPEFTIDRSLNSINNNWVLGLTVSHEYKNFTIMERKILKLYYIDDHSDQEIANQLGTCRATVNRRRNKAKDKLEDIYKEQHKIGE